MKIQVAPLVGAWIETFDSLDKVKTALSHPSWVRGLKRLRYVQLKQNRTVAPLVGAWIETNAANAHKAESDGRTPRGCVD